MNGSDYVRKLVNDKIGESMFTEQKVSITKDDMDKL